jgi:hypothetical protein
MIQTSIFVDDLMVYQEDLPNHLAIAADIIEAS